MPTKLFISYSHKDEGAKNTLRTYLDPVVRADLIDLWDDRRIPPGAPWAGEIAAALDGAGAAILLISKDFLASRYCLDVEITHLLEAQKKRGLRIFPILLALCHWKEVPLLKDLQMLPRDGKTIRSKRDREQTWTHVTGEIIAALKSAPAPAGGALPAVPPPPLHYVVRPHLVSRIAAAMNGGGAVLVGLQGAGGVGKTTLAADYARAHAARYARVVWLDVRDRGGRTESLAESLLFALGQPEARITSVEDGLRAVYVALEPFERAEQTLLFIFDNADHPDARFADFVKQLGGAGAHTLVTTRDQKLADTCHGLHLDVGQFEEDEAVACLARHLRDDPRARDTDGLHHVARRLGALPIAVHIAGTYLRWRRDLPLTQYGGELPDTARGESFDATFDITWRVLSETERAVFIACGACADTGFPIEAAAAAAGLDEPTARATLARLRDWSLLTERDDGTWLMHPLLRARTRRDEALGEAYERHADWLIGALVLGSYDLEPVERVKAEVAVAVADARARGDGARLIALCWRAGRYWRYRGPWAPADEALADALSAPNAQADDWARSNLLFYRANILKNLADWDTALSVLDEKDALDRRRRDPLGRVGALIVAGGLLRLRGDGQAARERLELALHLLDQHGGVERSRAFALHEFGMIAHLEGDLDVALNHHRGNCEIFERVGETGGLAGSQYGIALVHASRGAHREALALLDEVLALRRRLNRPADIAATLTAKGISHAALGEHAAAERSYEESLRLSRATGNTRWTAANLDGLAHLRIAQARPAEARPLLEEALPLYERTGQRDYITACHMLLATLPPA